MKAISLVPGGKSLRLTDHIDPTITAADEIKVKVLQVGVCGTDREEAAGGRALAPAGRPELIIGHEMLGLVAEVGEGVSVVRPGDYAVFTVRRGCGKCLPCSMNRSDMCRTGGYHERGIWGIDGYQTEFVVDREQYAVRIPRELAPVGVLTEPLSVAEKAVDEALRIQFSRLPDAPAALDWFHGRRCLVAGLGPIGLLAALVLRLRGAEVFGLDVVDDASARPSWLAGIGGRYVNGREVRPDQVQERIGPMDVIIEAAGVAELQFDLLDALALNGVYVLTGVPSGDRSLQLSGAELLRRLVLGNQVMAGSVNASHSHFQMAVDDLWRAHLQWGALLERLITHRHPYTDFAAALTLHGQDEIKVVLEWNA